MGLRKINLRAFVILGILSMAMPFILIAQTPTPVASIPETLSDQQWLSNVWPNFTGSYSVQEMAIMQKQLDLSNEQAKAVTVFGQMIGELHQSGKEEWYVETLQDRSGGKLSSNPEKINETKDKVGKNEERVKNSVRDFRVVMGIKEQDFVAWIQDEDFIVSDVSLITQKNINATSEEVANVVVKDMRQKLVGRDWDSKKYQKWIFNRAGFHFYRFLISREDVWKNKVRFNQIKEERKEQYEKMISE